MTANLEWENILKLVDCNTKALLWISDHPLEKKQEHWEIFDYLLDGLLVKTINQIITGELISNHTGLFISEHFQQPFYLIHHHHQENTDLDLNSLLKTISSQTDHCKMLVINDSKSLKKEKIEQKLKASKLELLWHE